MANGFDTSLAPEGEPSTITVGDYLQWKRTDLVTDYPVAQYSAEYVARITGGGANEIKVAGDESGGTYLFIVDSVTSAAFVPGYYHWQLEVTQTSSGNRIVVDTGEFTAVVDLDDNQADPRIHAEIMVGKIESLLQGKADSDVSSYSIAGRSLTKLSFQELVDARDYYRREIVVHRNKIANAKHKEGSSTIKVRF